MTLNESIGVYKNAIGQENFKLNSTRTDLVEDPYLASYAYQRIMEEIYEFESKLDNQHEVALRLAAFNKSILLSIKDIGYANPNLLFFYGTVDGQPAQLIQNVNQLNFLLLAVELKPNETARRIGFCTGE